MHSNLTSIKLNLSYVIISFFIIVAISCNDSHTGNNSSSAGALKNWQIEKLADNYQQGKNIFKEHCNECHVAPEIKMTDQYVFDNLFDRLPSPSEDYFVKYIRDSKSLKASGDRYAKMIDEAWNSKYEHYFKDSLSLQDFSNIIIYIKAAAKQKYKSNK
jgi:hypothetical protein